jgi:hypothetical protein
MLTFISNRIRFNGSGIRLGQARRVPGFFNLRKPAQSRRLAAKPEPLTNPIKYAKSSFLFGGLCHHLSNLPRYTTSITFLFPKRKDNILASGKWSISSDSKY